MVRGVVGGVVASRYLPVCLSEAGADWRQRWDLQRLQPLNIWAVAAATWPWGAQMFWVSCILIVVSVRFSSWVSLEGGLVHRGCRCWQIGHWCSFTTHWLQNQCCVSLPPQPSSWPRRPSS